MQRPNRPRPAASSLTLLTGLLTKPQPSLGCRQLDTKVASPSHQWLAMHAPAHTRYNTVHDGEPDAHSRVWTRDMHADGSADCHEHALVWCLRRDITRLASVARAIRSPSARALALATACA